MTRRMVAPTAGLLAGLLLLGMVALRIASARADEPTLGSFSLNASAPGYEVMEDEPGAQAHPEGQGAIPWTSTSLSNGGIGYGVASIAWPGPTFANGGSLVLVLDPASKAPAGPPQDALSQVEKGAAPLLQYPIRAEARTGSGSPDASYKDIPNVTMTAHADDKVVTGQASLPGANQQGAGTFGNMASNTASTLTGNVGAATATSVVHDVALAGGAIKIKSISSTATAKSDGNKADANGGTVVQGMTVNGQDVYVDKSGVHAGKPGQPGNAAADAILKQVMDPLGMKMYLGDPQSTIQGAAADYSAGSLVLFWKPPNNPNANVFTVTFGGARVSVNAASGSDAASTADVGSSAGAGGDTGAPAVAGTTGESVPGDAGTPAIPGEPAGATTATGTQSSAPTRLNTGRARPILASSFRGIGGQWILLGLVALALLAVATTRLRDALLDRGVTASCPLEEGR